MIITPGKYFWRNDICCLLTVNDAGIWWGHVGLGPSHPHHGCRFIRLHPVSVSSLAMPPMLSGDIMESKWWMGFEGGYSAEKTLDSLKTIADQLALRP